MPTSPPRLFRSALSRGISRGALFACCVSLAHAGAAFGQASSPAFPPPPAPPIGGAAVPGTQIAPPPEVIDDQADPQARPTTGQPGHGKPDHGKPGPSRKEVVYYHDGTEVIGPLEGMCLTIKSKILQMQAQPMYLDDYLRRLRDKVCPWCRPECEYPANPYGVYGYGSGYGGNAFVPTGYAPAAYGPMGYGHDYGHAGQASPYGRVYDPQTGRMFPPGSITAANPAASFPPGAAVPQRGYPQRGYPMRAGAYPPARQTPGDQTTVDARLNLPSMGGYSMAYPTNPHYFDPRDGRIYAAQGYGQPVAQPLAPNVHMTYNYSHGFPGSRLTPVSRMPAPQP